jgi:WD40 repeat protein/serine/threonine protein kinase
MESNADCLIELFHAAKARPVGIERDRFLREACQGQPEIQQQVLSLLEADQEVGDFLDSRLPNLPKAFPAEKPGDKLGHYKLLEQIGEGGCGVVYLAEQEEPVRRRVALKIIKLGMDTRAVVARFEAERQALALMEHPNIARVLEAGSTAAGRPYFIMELVRGRPITHYCEEAELSIDQRLRLFMRVCYAVQHAHQKGVIHRDLKPSNVLVMLYDGVAVPKVIDFGIAKATSDQQLTDKTVFTAVDQFIGTPAYMSPEQAERGGLDIDTRSDIYSLGVLLYALLTGTTPFDTQELLRAGPEGMRRIIRERNPARPSTRLARLRHYSKSQLPIRKARIHGDLDCIVMKCLEKDRARRYPTANELAADLNRYLNHEPIEARPPSAIYRAQQAFRRNKVAGSAGAVVAIALLLSTIISARQTLKATRAQDEQLRLRQEADRLRLRAEQNLYAADLLLAYEALGRGHLGRSRELLTKYSVGSKQAVAAVHDLRGWEWRHLWERTRGDESIILRGHTGEVAAALFLEDGRTVFSASHDGTLRFWDSETKAELARLPYPDEPRRAALSPNGAMLAVDGSLTGYWWVLDAHRRHILHSATNSSPVLGAAFSPDSQLLAVASRDKIALIRTSDWRKLTEIRKSAPIRNDLLLAPVAFSPNGSLLAYSTSDGGIHTYDLESGAAVGVGRSERGEALTLCFARDGQSLVSGDRECISVWDLGRPGQFRRLTDHTEQVVCLALSPDGALLASASGDHTIKLWNTTTWEPVATLRGHEHEVRAVAFSPDGRRLVSSGKDNTIRIWPVPTASARSDRFVLSRSGALLPPRPSAGRLIDFDWIRERATTMDVLMKESSSQVLPAVFKSRTCVSLSADAAIAAVGFDDGSVELWQTAPFRHLRVLKGSGSRPVASAWARTQHRLAVARADGATELWDLGSERIVKRLPPLPAPLGVGAGAHYREMDFWCKDSILTRVAPAARGAPDMIELYFTTEGEPRLVFPRHNGYLNNLTVSHDGKLLVTSGWDGTLKLWDTDTGRQLETLRGQLVAFTSVAFSLDDKRLVAGAWDGSVTVWDVGIRQQVAYWKAHNRFCLVDFTDDGRVLLTIGEKTGERPFELALWRAPNLDEINAAGQKGGQLPRDH